MNKKMTVAVLMVFSFLVGAALTWWLQGNHAEKERGSVTMLRAVEVAGLCANVLVAAEEGRSATVQRVLEARMTSAVNEAAEQVGRASSPGLAIPNLIEGLNRARRYAVAKRMPEVAGKCDRVLEFLTKSNARA